MQNPTFKITENFRKVTAECGTTREAHYDTIGHVTIMSSWLYLALCHEGRAERTPCPVQGAARTTLPTPPKMPHHFWELFFLPRLPSRLKRWKTSTWQTRFLPSTSSSIWPIPAPPRISSSLPGASPPPWLWSTWAPEVTLRTKWPKWVSVTAPDQDWTIPELNCKVSLILRSSYLDCNKVSNHRVPLQHKCLRFKSAKQPNHKNPELSIAEDTLELLTPPIPRLEAVNSSGFFFVLTKFFI